MGTRLGVLLAVLAGLAFINDAPGGDSNGFAFLYETGGGARVDTFGGLVTKDMVIGPDTTIACVLPQADLDSVRRRMIAIHFFELPEPHPEYPSCPGMGQWSPSTTIRIQAKLGQKMRQLSWDSGYLVCDDPKTKKQWDDLHKLEMLIWDIMEKQPRYKALPPARGGYL